MIRFSTLSLESALLAGLLAAAPAAQVAQGLLPFRNPQRLLGMENEGKLDLDPQSLREAYLEEVRQHVRTLQDQARRFHYDHELVDTSKDVGPPLSHFLARRAARLK